MHANATPCRGGCLLLSLGMLCVCFVLFMYECSFIIGDIRNGLIDILILGLVWIL